MPLGAPVAAPLVATGQAAPGAATMQQAAPAGTAVTGFLTTDKAAAAWAIGAIVALAIMRRAFKGSVI